MNARIPTEVPRPFVPAVLHLVRLDLRRFRLLAAVVVALEAGRAAFVEWSLHLVPAQIGEHFGGTFGGGQIALLDVAIWLAIAVTTAMIAQADLPSDDRAFWRTRPIPPATLAVAKVVTLALLFVAVPSAINAGRLLAYGAPLSATCAATLQLAVLSGFTAVPAWALALVTRTLPRFFGAAVGLLVGSYLVMFAAMYWSQVWFGAAGAWAISPGMVTAILDWQRIDVHGWVGALVVTIGAFGILVAHYRHRRPAVSAMAALGLLAAAWLLPQRESHPPAPAALARLVSGRLGIARLAPPPARVLEWSLRSPTPVPLNLSVRLSLPDLPADVSATVHLRRIRLGGHEDVPVGDGSQCCFSRGAIGAITPAPTGPRSPELVLSSESQGFTVALTDLEKLRDRTVAVEADAEVRFKQHRLVAAVPLRAGAAIRVGGRLLEILDVEPRRSALLIRFAEFPSLSEAGDAGLTFFVGDEARTRLTATSAGWGITSPRESFIRKGLWLSGRQWVGRFHVLVSDAAALDPDAQLYVVESRPAGAVHERLRVNGLQLSTPRQEAR